MWMRLRGFSASGTSLVMIQYSSQVAWFWFQRASVASQLIDWYPGSSVLAMRRSVRKLLDHVTRGGGASSLRVALPGHNGVMEGAERFRAASERHLEMSASATRTAKKAVLSRPRATATLALNSRVMSMPESVRDGMKA